jgi:hypothetical protein
MGKAKDTSELASPQPRRLLDFRRPHRVWWLAKALVRWGGSLLRNGRCHRLGRGRYLVWFSQAHRRDRASGQECPTDTAIRRLVTISKARDRTTVLTIEIVCRVRPNLHLIIYLDTLAVFEIGGIQSRLRVGRITRERTCAFPIAEIGRRGKQVRAACMVPMAVRPDDVVYLRSADYRTRKQHKRPTDLAELHTLLLQDLGDVLLNFDTWDSGLYPR